MTIATMASSPYTSRRFTLEEQMAFARLSGDYNPIHVDPLAARRLLFGGPVVHGVHLILWSLDELLTTCPKASRLRRLRASFAMPALVGQEVRVSTTKPDERAVRARIMAADQSLTEIMVFFGDSPPHIAVESGSIEATLPLAADIEELASAAGHQRICVDSELLSRLFPTVARILDPGVTGVLLATTHLVGMVCPGLHSLFAEIDLTFSDGIPEVPEGTFNYAVSRCDRRFSRLELRVSGREFKGKLKAFVRPPPAAQLSMPQALDLIQGSPFQNHRALIIGGSRGLGEVTAKLLSAGGAHVTLTYAAGQKDADAVVSEIAEHGGAASAVHCDVLAGKESGPKGHFTHLYYFASPRILRGRKAPFDVELFQTYCAFFVDGFASLVTKVNGLANVFYPSTVYLDKPEHGFTEYAAAKAAGEAFCHYLQHERTDLYVHVARLPRMRTDQTQTITPLMAGDLAEPTEVIKRILLQKVEFTWQRA